MSLKAHCQSPCAALMSVLVGILSFRHATVMINMPILNEVFRKCTHCSLGPAPCLEKTPHPCPNKICWTYLWSNGAAPVFEISVLLISANLGVYKLPSSPSLPSHFLILSSGWTWLVARSMVGPLHCVCLACILLPPGIVLTVMLPLFVVVPSNVPSTQCL